ncbi:MAG: Gfo/Idh/MocA family oxidoreductase [Bacteroidetes bacterium]|nr:Gfo/Idh/MocA family oxidoreductase [Bacteroidota bacterium]
MEEKLFNINRRHFLRGSFASLVLSTYGLYGFDLMNPTKRYRVGLIGTGWYGKSDLFRLMQVTKIDVVCLCDVDEYQLKEAADLIQNRQPGSKRPQLYKDYRTLLVQHELDIVLIGTPDHWHALQCIAAMESGAHVYLQKPISVDVVEGEAVVAAANKMNKVVQVGLQRRNTPHLVEAKQNIVDAGLLGKIAHVELCCYYHMRSQANPSLQEVPDHLDYELWTGPAPLLPYDGLPHRGWWRAFMEYGNGIMGDMCVHMFDATRWLLDLDWPNRISSQGGIYVQKEGKSNISDTQTAVFEYDDLQCVWQHRTWGTPADPEYPWAFKIYGEHGTLAGSPMKYDFISNSKGKKIHKDCLYERTQFPEDLTEKDIELHAAPATRLHMLDFLKAIEEKQQPIASIEEGHRSTASCILANLSMKLNRPLEYDTQLRIVKNDPEATKLLKRSYREGWRHPLPEDFI